jgi:hypothetical protein
VFYEQLASIQELGHEVHLWHFADQNHRAQFDRVIADDPEPWVQVQSMCSSINLTALPADYSLGYRLKDWIYRRLPNPRVYWPQSLFILLPQLKKLINEITPDVIWAQTFWSAEVCSLQKEVPYVYSHLDWYHRIKALRNKKAPNFRAKRVQERVARLARAVISGSQVEREQLQEIGCSNVFYIPIAYSPVEFQAEVEPKKFPWIVHFGGLATTANRRGLERFYEVVWPRLQHDTFDFYMVGDLTDATPKLEEFLSQVICTGHVVEWDSVLHHYDIQIIPWEHSTGQRTRIPVALNYGQVVVAVRDGDRLRGA